MAGELLRLEDARTGEVLHIDPAEVAVLKEVVAGDARLLSVKLADGDRYLVRDDARAGVDRVNRARTALFGEEVVPCPGESPAA